jgi:hypothetical protein
MSPKTSNQSAKSASFLLHGRAYFSIDINVYNVHTHSHTLEKQELQMLFLPAEK